MRSICLVFVTMVGWTTFVQTEFASLSVFGDTVWNCTGEADWNTNKNWSNGIPELGTSSVIIQTGTVLLSTAGNYGGTISVASVMKINHSNDTVKVNFGVAVSPRGELVVDSTCSGNVTFDRDVNVQGKITLSGSGTTQVNALGYGTLQTDSGSALLQTHGTLKATALKFGGAATFQGKETAIQATNVYCMNTDTTPKWTLKDGASLICNRFQLSTVQETNAIASTTVARYADCEIEGASLTVGTLVAGYNPNTACEVALALKKGAKLNVTNTFYVGNNNKCTLDVSDSTIIAKNFFIGKNDYVGSTAGNPKGVVTLTGSTADVSGDFSMQNASTLTLVNESKVSIAGTATLDAGTTIALKTSGIQLLQDEIPVFSAATLTNNGVTLQGTDVLSLVVSDNEIYAKPISTFENQVKLGRLSVSSENEKFVLETNLVGENLNSFTDWIQINSPSLKITNDGTGVLSMVIPESTSSILWDFTGIPESLGVEISSLSMPQLMSTTNNTIAETPEPSSLWLLFVGVCFFVRKRWTKT